MKGTLSVLAESSELVEQIDVHDTSIDWVLDINGRTVRSSADQGISRQIESLILLELAGFMHAITRVSNPPSYLSMNYLTSTSPVCRSPR
jgi:hypothetical protein